MAAGDFNNDHKQDLVISETGSDNATGTGPVHIVTGVSVASPVTATHLTASRFVQGDGIVPPSDGGLGDSLAVNDFSGDGFSDLAVGEPFYGSGVGAGMESGAVVVLNGTGHASPLTSVGARLWTEDVLIGCAAQNDLLGWSLAAG